MKTATPELMDKLFRVDNAKPCVDFLYQIGSRVVDSVDPGDTEYSFVSFWDDLICHIQGSRYFSSVVKCFPTALFQRAKDHVEAVYNVLEEHAIPSVDRLDLAYHNEKRLISTPRGQEKRRARKCVASIGEAACCFVDASRYSMAECYEESRWREFVVPERFHGRRAKSTGFTKRQRPVKPNMPPRSSEMVVTPLRWTYGLLGG
ncbi:unnamed protein product [Phytophthora fragariaefolia]|uniref:Unnamed protein product n=1 Tax=Phytophthora fragariaefolia TaxID=1490495 RepID=A0A9W7CY65_9STRA|nr:unnamed protein product [Phytophthora fragariaefolia]